MYIRSESLFALFRVAIIAERSDTQEVKSCLYVAKGGIPAAPSSTATLLRLHLGY
jgi:hypothetical protein